MSPDYTILINRLQASGITFPFMVGVTPVMLEPTNLNINAYPNVRFSGAVVEQWYRFAGHITGHTNDKLNQVKSYDDENPYIPNLVFEDINYNNYLGNQIHGLTMVTNLAEPITYAMDAAPLGIGTLAQATGLRYQSYTGASYTIFESDTLQNKPRTDFRYVGEGWNATNVGLSANTSMDYLLGIVSPPEVQSDLFIDRGNTTVMEDHLRLGEIKGLDALLDYGNGYYKVGL
tara:strand:+ start:2975 stop:3670 length:696 start_codon:yes stop_codon:yes gene_type:complete